MIGSSYARTVLADPSGNQRVGFVGAGLDPANGDILLGWSQTLGETDPALRGHAPPSWYTAMGTTGPNFHSSDPDYAWDTYPLANTNEYRRSADRGASFSSERSDTLASTDDGTNSGIIFPHPLFPQADIWLPGGGQLRRVNGEDMPWESAYESTVRCERWNGSAWVAAGSGNNLYFGANPAATTVQIGRIRRLRNGSLLAIGQSWPAAAGTRSGVAGMKPYLAVSADDGATWASCLTLANGGAFHNTGYSFVAWEGDFVELPDGDLLTVWRSWTIGWNGTTSPSSTTLVQQLLEKTGENAWTQTEVPILWPASAGASPAPRYPDLIAFRSGDTDHILLAHSGNAPAASGFYTCPTNDLVNGWSAMTITGKNIGAVDPYYARAVVAYKPDLTPVINIFGHAGGADTYHGEADTKVVQHRFEAPGNTYEWRTPTVPSILKLGSQAVRVAA